MQSLGISLSSRYHDLHFIPAYITALVSAQYALATHPTAAAHLISSISSIFTPSTQSHSQSATPPTTSFEIWPIPVWAMVPVCIVLAISTAGIMKSVKADKLYATLILAALGLVFGGGKVLDLDAEVVVFGLFPLAFVSALNLVRVAQAWRGTEESAEVRLSEKV
ncbi:uncharacterized protein K444DRAFT_618447 [Hyaloscypha bicolor E]|uniref:Uncharacterized protein n=1 Tax=Hyaloscypha bicolor E TaxID=1095630 RepID=A0A2J6STB5_9HELO|nr:uncharacterized protein K444DRAFT_618447 [Hyaloscypha bicolor E]PMD53992.1 hypothetical protein K444DRAFT_618447 [Hyaloscypha bicolor E]